MRTLVAVMVIALMSLIVAGCSDTNAVYPSSVPGASEPIVVSLLDLRPTVSMDATIASSPVFAVLATANGAVSNIADPGSAVIPGTPVATIDGVAVSSPVAGIVVGVLVDADQEVPMNLPLVAIRYAGFALEGTPTNWAEGLLYQPGVTARGQVTSGTGPVSCAAMVPSASTDAMIKSSSGSDGVSPAAPARGSSVNWMCLLPKDAQAAGGQAGVVVAVGTVARQVLAVPVTSVAGRVGAGQVTLMGEQGPEVVSVTLGRTDGSYIEVVEGLHVGDKISPVAPNLTTKTPR